VINWKFGHPMRPCLVSDCITMDTYISDYRNPRVKKVLRYKTVLFYYVPNQNKVFL